MKKPNIVYVITDQYRTQAMGFWNKPEYREAMPGGGDPVYTPQLDKFADESIVFNQAISNCPLCSPYRGMLLSGRYPENNGVKMNCRAGRTDSLREDITCLTDVLAESGYSTGYIGKYHLDMPELHFDKARNYVGEGGGFYADGSKEGDKPCWDMVTPPGKKRHGIDYWYGYNTFDVHKNPHYWDNTCTKHEPKIWSPKHEAEIASNYILNTEGQRDAEKSYCLFVSMNPPHPPYCSIDFTDEEMYEKYYSPHVVEDVKKLLERPNVMEGKLSFESVRCYFASVSGVDRQFGRILDAIGKSGEKDNTIVVFSSDHGDLMFSHGECGKNNAHEEAFLIPFLIRYPKKLHHRIEDLMIGGPDIMPTLLSLAGLEDKIPEDIDGFDYSDILLESETPKVQKPKSALYMQFRPHLQKKGVRTDRYTMVIERDENGQFQKHNLYDNQNDIYQEHNLEFEDIDSKDLCLLKSELGKWLKKSGDLWYRDRVFSDFIIYPD